MTPGAYKECRDYHGPFDALAARLGEGPALALVDARVLALHPHVRRALSRKNVTLVAKRAGERLKTLQALEELCQRALWAPRQLTMLAVGGGTIGDLATVFAHTFKRGVARLIHAPSTLLAAVDSSVGGKGALNVAGVKNALGVFHAADEAWLCPELFTTLSQAQRREGRLEAWKMAVVLDARRWRRWSEAPPDDDGLMVSSRALKHALVKRDPYDTKGLRLALNFGHTLGHAIESLSGHKVRHGDAVGLGMLYALDLGVALGVTPRSLAREVERSLPLARGARRQLERWLAPPHRAALRGLMAADKKKGMVLLTRPGRWRLIPFSSLPRLLPG